MDSSIEMAAPIPLIKNTEGKLEVCPEGLDVLCKIHQPVVVVSIVGNARTGKSYLMNKLAGKNAGFILGSSIESETKGIWMWCVPYQGRPDQTLILLDTEGLGDVNKGDSENDSWIFALAVLLSSTLIYNSFGSITQEAMEKLHYVTELTMRIKSKASPVKEVEDSAEFVGFFPTFIWTLRDFTLDLKLKGHPITADEYLDTYGLELKTGNTKEIQQYNLPRKCIRMFFPTRKCFAFGRPTEEKKLKDLEKLQEKDLYPDFVEKVNQFCHYVYEKSEKKTIPGGHVVTGRQLAKLVENFVDTICKYDIPCMENAVLRLAEMENTAAVHEAVARYDELMEQNLNLPTETLQELLEIHAQCEEEALQVFMDHSFKDEMCYFQIKLMKTVYEKKEYYCQKNEQASTKHCSDILARLSQNLRDKIKNGGYITPGGYQLFLTDQKRIKKEYFKQSRKGIMAEVVLNKFLKDKDEVGKIILQSDECFTEKEKEMADAKMKEEAETQAMKIWENQEIMQKQEEGQKYQSYSTHIKRLKEKVKEESTSALEEINRIISAKYKVQNYFKIRGLFDCGSIMETEINYFKQQADQTKDLSFSFPRMEWLLGAGIAMLGLLTGAAALLLFIMLKLA